ncbi:MAG: Nif3-like dinuclear metal center hexameric protein [Anaerolineales bacterium]|nr:Nif3-like dinuclear metal center hexameric protein [Anaerolineales bacterium]MCB8952350.1 Nif3-like dinuclear metal center hexameric protein [Ardenticatenales bacterium]
MKRNELTTYLDDYLRIGDIKDYGPQGLQLESDNQEVRRVALAVDVAPPVIEAAGAWGADMLLVHHGILWRSVERLAGPLGERVRRLLRHGINLYAAHLPLDAHAEVGNNAVLARLLNVKAEAWWCEVMGTKLGVCGPLPESAPLSQFVQQVNEQLHTTARVLSHGPALVNRVAILSGFGADEVAAAAALGADTYVTGETSHAHYWAAADHHLNVIFAGHYATETVGVQALGAHLARHFGLETRFFDFPTDM